MCAAELDDGAARALVHVDDEDLEIVTAAKLLGANLVILHHEDFVLVIEQQGDRARRRVDAAHLRRENLAHLVSKVLEDGVALGLANALQDDLLGRLRGNAPKVLGFRFDLDYVAELHGSVDLAGVLECNLGAHALDLFHYLAFGEDAHLAGVAVHFGADAGHRAIVALISRNQRSFNCLENDLTVQPLVGGHLINACNQGLGHTW